LWVDTGAARDASAFPVKNANLQNAAVVPTLS